MNLRRHNGSVLNGERQEVGDGIRKHDAHNHRGNRIQGIGLGLLVGTGMSGKGGMMIFILMA